MGAKPGTRVRREQIQAETADESDKPFDENAPIQTKIRELAGLGIPVADIAAKVGCKVADLRDGGKYHTDVNVGLADGNIAVARSLMKKAIQGVPAMAIFYAKCRMGWNEAGSRETAEGKKTREIKKIEWTVIDGDGGKRSVKAKSTGPGTQRQAERAADTTQHPVELYPSEGGGEHPSDGDEAPPSDAPVDGAPSPAGEVQSGARRSWRG